MHPFDVHSSDTSQNDDKMDSLFSPSAATTAPSSSELWYQFLKIPAISYVVDLKSANGYYWHADLLERWQQYFLAENTVDEVRGVSSISYGALLLLASHVTNILRRRLSLTFSDEVTTTNKDFHQYTNLSNASKNGDGSLRIGIAIPEGPFLPLFVLAVHALNVAVGDLLLHPYEAQEEKDNSHSELKDDEEINYQKCKGVILIPMETDEAPHRLKHILNDCNPDIILVAPGKDWDTLSNVLDFSLSNPSSIQLVDYISICQEALSSIQLFDGISILSSMFPQSVQDEAIDSIRYSHAIPGCWDVARLVLLGCAQEAHSNATFAKSFLPSQQVASHVVYTSGTTGRPKGCLSSLSSLQNYIRAKNVAHKIMSRKSVVLLASAVTFDPCFSDVLATFAANATLGITTRDYLYGYDILSSACEAENYSTYHGLTKVLRQLRVTHVLCTPTLWSTVEGYPPQNAPSLKIVALGGEPIPKAMKAKWARSNGKCEVDNESHRWNRDYPRLFATYGVTEACVYQTCGEVVQSSDGKLVRFQDGGKFGQSVGLPLLGTQIHIWRQVTDECPNEPFRLDLPEQTERDSNSFIGEVVLAGAQVDNMSSYLNLQELTRKVFIQPQGDGSKDKSVFYRTGDLGYIDSLTKNLHILGRIRGDGMVKINGIRIELAEIESAIIDDVIGATNDNDDTALVVDCLATATTMSSSNFPDDSDSHQKQLIAYCVLSPICFSQLCLKPDRLKGGLIVTPGPLYVTLKERCNQRVRKGCTPSFFILIDRLPLSPTGKRDRSKLPPLLTCSLMEETTDKDEHSLWKYGIVGPIVANKICECLNLQSCQRNLITRKSNFFILGGDSLAATRVCRGLYALHHGVVDSRNLGGEVGMLDGPFAAKFLLQSTTLGEYVDFLHSYSAFGAKKLNTMREVNVPECLVPRISHHNSSCTTVKSEDHDENRASHLFESLIEATTLGLVSIALALLDLGANPNLNQSQGRLGKVKDRNLQRRLFNTNPLHLACIRGNPILVKRLLAAGCKANTPDASGQFPIHLACTRLDYDINASNLKIFQDEDTNRLKCVKMLLDSGIPISMRDGNKQTILHSASRSGHCKLLQFIMTQWKTAAKTRKLMYNSQVENPDEIFEWYDRWFRTPVHWAILNQRVETLQILLDGGCCASPSLPHAGVSKRKTSMMIESPLEICKRMYGDSSGIGKQMSILLLKAIQGHSFH